jgi:hypothetical protein
MPSSTTNCVNHSLVSTAVEPGVVGGASHAHVHEHLVGEAVAHQEQRATRDERCNYTEQRPQRHADARAARWLVHVTEIRDFDTEDGGQRFRRLVRRSAGRLDALDRP